MESKSKKFTRKLVAFFLAVIMAVTCFTGTMTVYANSIDDYHDDNLIANFMAWADATDEQTAEALLDYLDGVLSGLNAKIYFSQSIVVATIKIDACIDSVDGIIDLAAQADDLLGSYGSLVGGDVKNIDLSPLADLSYSTTQGVVAYCGKSYRAVNDAKDIVRAIAKALYINSNDFAGKNVFNQLIKGEFDLGSILEGVLGGSIYDLLKGALGMWDGYESNLAYNVVANLIFSNTLWYTEDEVAAFKADMSTWNFDEQLYSKMTDELLNKINVLVTYPSADGTTDSSATRRAEIDAYMEANACDYATAASALGYDANLIYSEELTNNVLLFCYGDEKLEVTKDTTLYDLALQAIKLAWKTVLAPTVGLLHVNYDNKADSGAGSNFDNVYYYWVRDNKGWDSDDVDANYSEANINEWATAMYEAYGKDSPEAFLEDVKTDLTWDRSVVDEPKYNWQDINATQLFLKLRYSPLADKGFDMQTGPINLYFLQLGYDNIENFFDGVVAGNYSTVLGGLNDALVAACNDIFVTSDNIKYGDVAIAAPSLATTGDLAIVGNEETAIATIVDTLATNALKVLEYTANAADMNILNAFYTNNGITFDGTTYNLKETNLEEAMVPLLVTCLNEIVMLDPVHDEKWDMAGDAEAIAVVALEEYLAFVLPDKDYSVLYTTDANGMMTCSDIVIDIDENGTVQMLDVVLVMARDALGYILGSLAPLRDENWNVWSAYDSQVTDTTSAFDLINSLLVYYAEGTNGANSAGSTWDDGTQGQGLAQLLGCVDGSGNSLVTKNNDLWTNINVVFNHLLPAIGVLTNGDDSGWGNADSYELIYEGIIQSFLNIGDAKDTQYKYSGFAGEFGGVRNFLAGFATVLAATPITSEKLGIVVYDYLLVPIMNAIFGARYTGQGYTHLLPYSCYYDVDSSSNTASDTPFDSFLHVDTLGNFSHTASGSGRSWTYTDDGNTTGMLGILICNVYEAFGGNSDSSYINLIGVDGCWQGLSFAVQAVSTFIPGFVSTLRDHALGLTTTWIDNASQQGTAGSAFTSTNLIIANNSKGLNRYYKTADGTMIQDGRYFVDVTGIKVTDIDGNTVSNVNVGATTTKVAPGERAEISISGTVQSDSANKVYVITTTYDIYTGKLSGTTLPTKTSDNTLYSGVTTQCYFFLTTEVSWADTLYTRTGDPNNCRWFDADLEGSNDYVTQTSKGGTSNQLQAQIASDLIVQMSNPSAINDYGFRVINSSNSWFGSNRAFDGLIVCPTSGTEYQTITGFDSNGIATTSATTTFSADDYSVAFGAIDKTNGDLLNYNLYDYTTDGGTTWNRGSAGSEVAAMGYTYEEITALGESVTNAEGFATRTHVAFTLQEAYNAGVVSKISRTAVGVDDDGITEYVYNYVLVTPSTTLMQGTYAESGKQSISWGTPTAGIYITSAKQEVEKGKSVYSRWIGYDGSTTLQADSYDMNVFVYTTNNQNMKATVSVQIVDDTAAAGLQSSYNSKLNTISQYQESDFSDAQAYKDMQTALGNALQAIATPVNVANAASFGSTTIAEAKTVDAWDIFGDAAYTPIQTSTALPASVAVGATAGSNGYWYYNEECTMPVYGPTPVSATATGTVEFNGVTYETSADVLGTALVKGEDGVWYYLNAPKYETAWDITTYEAPYKYETTTQVGSGEGETPVYEEVSFVYRDANGDKCTSKEDWAVKIAETSVIVKPNDGNEYRGSYQRAADALDYYWEVLIETLNVVIAEEIVTRVVEVRQGMNNVNHDVVSYENMVKVAKVAEAMLITEWVETDEPQLDADGNPVVDEATGETVYVWEPVYSTTNSSIQVAEAIRVFETYYNERVINRNYIGDKLEAEIECAGGNPYTAFDFVATENAVIDEATGEAVVDADGNAVTTTSYEVSTTATTVPYGAVVDGQLVNEGPIVYTEDSWAAYETALGAAIDLADQGNADATDNDARVSNTYSTRTALMIAENNLTEAAPESTDITVAGTITIADSLDGTTGGSGIIGINVALADGTVVATSAADGTFTATVPAGTTSLVITGTTTIDRTVSLAGDANIEGVTIPIVICDYNKDGAVSAADTGIYAQALTGTYNVYCDFNADGSVAAADTGIYSKFIGKTIAYADLTLA